VRRVLLGVGSREVGSSICWSVDMISSVMWCVFRVEMCRGYYGSWMRLDIPVRVYVEVSVPMVG